MRRATGGGGSGNEPEYNSVEAGTFYVFSPQSERPARRNAVVVVFSVALLFFAAFALSKLPFIAAQVGRGLPVEFSSNLAAVGLSTGVATTTSWTFLVPHITVAAALNVLFALIMLRRVRMSTPLVRHGVFVLTVVHCALIAPNWTGLPGPVGNVVFMSICLFAALQLQFVDGKSQLGFSWLVLAVNSGPVGEVAFWLLKLHDHLLAWRQSSSSLSSMAAASSLAASSAAASPMAASEGGGGQAGDGGASAAATAVTGAYVVGVGDDSSASALPTSLGYGVLVALGMLTCALVVLVFGVVAVYNIWFFTSKHGALPRSLLSWTRGT
jgi:hypothetical protein